jgi:hypothetical protein
MVFFDRIGRRYLLLPAEIVVKLPDSLQVTVYGFGLQSSSA